MIGGRILLFAGIFLLFMGTIAIIAGPEDPSQAVTGRLQYFVLFICSGVALTLIGIKNIKKAKRIKKYMDLIIHLGIRSLTKIAAVSGISPDLVEKDIPKMLDKGFLPGAYMNDVRKELVIPDTGFEYEAYPQHYQFSVQCKNCGANNTVTYGFPAYCEYCSSLINNAPY